MIDWAKIPQSLDKELQQITAASETDKCIADKLYQVWLLDQREVWILIHIEVQSQYESGFSERMYIYNYRAFDLYQKPVVSLAVLGDERLNWRPNSYSYDLGGYRIIMEYPIVKLLDYQSQWDELASNSNPFAIIVMAHLKTKATTASPNAREEWKWLLVRGLYDRGLGRERIIKLFQIIDRMMVLPNQLQQSLNTKIKQFEEERTMPLLSNMELTGIEHGKEIGKLQKIHDDIKMVLQVRLGEITSDLEGSLHQISDLSVLDETLKLAATANSLEEFKQYLQNI